MLTNKKKIKELQNLLTDPTLKFLIIHGPAGCGKHITLKMLCKELNFEYISSISHTGCYIPKLYIDFQKNDFYDENAINSQLQEMFIFLNQLTEINKPLKYFFGLGKISNLRGKLSKKDDKISENQYKQKIYVIEGLPNWAKIISGDLRQKFIKLLSKFFEQIYPHVKYILMINDPDEM